MSFTALLQRTPSLGKFCLRSSIKRSFYSRSWFRPYVHARPRANNNLTRLAATVATLSAAYAAYNAHEVFENDANIHDDQGNTVDVDRSVTPFPTQLGPSELPISTKYVLLGYGTRSVTFVSFRVYALGIYIAEQDLHLIPDVLNSKFLSSSFIDTNSDKPHRENVKDAISDPNKSLILIGSLLDSGARMLVKVTPVRNTDFNHLRDGFVKTILNHPEAKRNQQVLTSGLEQLKRAFTINGKVAKDDDLIVELQANGSLQLSYYDRKKDRVTGMGQVNEPIVGKFLFSQYMGGPKPLSPSAKESVASHIVRLV